MKLGGKNQYICLMFNCRTTTIRKTVSWWSCISRTGNRYLEEKAYC